MKWLKPRFSSFFSRVRSRISFLQNSSLSLSFYVFVSLSHWISEHCSSRATATSFSICLLSLLFSCEFIETLSSSNMLNEAKEEKRKKEKNIEKQRERERETEKRKKRKIVLREKTTKPLWQHTRTHTHSRFNYSNHVNTFSSLSRTIDNDDNNHWSVVIGSILKEENVFFCSWVGNQLEVKPVRQLVKLFFDL